jgi:predicted CxxxxCH...CXXCH cytochrome family protein
MKYYFVVFISIIGITLLIDGCSKLQENITQPQALSIHSKGIDDTSSASFHGTVLKANNFNLDECKKCHAANFQGGITNVSCYNCHNFPHQPGIADTTSPDFHGKFLFANHFVMDECQKCHGNDFSGNGSDKLNCKNCHTQTTGPLACNTCHGNFQDPSRIAPPRDVNGNSSTNLITIGAHTSHLYENDFAVVACENCHKVPNTSNIKNHFNPVPQSNIVILDSLAIHGIASNAVFDPNTGTCSNTYCHGNFVFNKSDAPAERQFAYTSDKMTGNFKTVNWTLLDGSQAPCGSCHGTTDGFISPEGHIKLPITECVACHSTVVNEKGEIIDKSKHINGQINYALGKKR